MAKDKLVTLSLLKEYDKLKCPPVQYVDTLPDTAENGLYAVAHSEEKTTTKNTKFRDILNTYFTEVTTGKWTIKTGYTVKIDENYFKSAVVADEQVAIYEAADWTGTIEGSYTVETNYDFTVTETINHTDYYAGNATTNTYTMIANAEQVARWFISITEKGAPSGVATLDLNGKIPVEQLPTEALTYKGQWDPNSGAYPADGKKTGEFYIVSADGVFDNIEWFVNDWLIWNGTKWEKSFNHQDVNSVNGQKGVVVLHGENIPIIEQTEETTDDRSIKEYIDDITVDGEAKDASGNYTSKVVVEVTALPTDIENRIYYKDTDPLGKTKYCRWDGTLTFTFFVSAYSSFDKHYSFVPASGKAPAYILPVEMYKDRYCLTELHVNDDVYYLGGTEEGEWLVEGGLAPIYYTRDKIAVKQDDDENLLMSFATKGYKQVNDLKITKTDKAYLIMQDLTHISTKEVYAKDLKLALDSETVKSVNTLTPDTDGNVEQMVQLTKAEYDLLVFTGKDDPNVVYAVTDELASVDIINDFQTAENLTWSSTKISNAIAAATPVVFDNTKSDSTTKGWTSSKISSAISGLVDDVNVATTTTWSSSKIEAVNTVNETLLKQYVADNYEPKNADLATKTWVGEQNYIDNTKIYMDGDTLVINL